MKSTWMRVISVIWIFCLIGLTACSNNVVKSGSKPVALISIEDQPNAWGNLFRYVIWNGESYGPKAFVIEAGNTGVKKIELAQGGTIQIQCAIALGKAIHATVMAGPDVSGGARQLVGNGSESMNACKIPVHIPHPKLAADEYYVKVAKRQALIEGEQPMDFNAFSDHLVKIGAKAIVMRDPTIADAMCLAAIAAHARIQLLEVEPSGDIKTQQITGVGSIKQGCSQESTSPR